MKNFTMEIKWAIVFTLIGLAWMYMEMSSGWHDEEIENHAFYTMFYAIPAIAVYVVALMDKRKNFYNGIMTYGQGFKSGVIITVLVALLSPLSQYISSTYISPDYFANVINYSVSTGAMTQEIAEAQFNLNTYLIYSFVGALIMGIITSAIVAIFTMKKAR